ncbi:MAG: hypothetical protein ABI670_09040 [Chloroflexota bacterium]
MAENVHDQAHYARMNLAYATIHPRLSPWGRPGAPSLSEFRRALQAADCANCAAFCFFNHDYGLPLGSFGAERSLRAIKLLGEKASPTHAAMMQMCLYLVSEIDDVYYHEDSKQGRDFMPDRYHKVLQDAQVYMLSYVVGYEWQTGMFELSAL